MSSDNKVEFTKDNINTVGDRYELPNGWLNSDFVKTDSYSPKLYQYSTFYRTYSNIVTIRTVEAEYLIAMKLRSGRQYKSDLSDVLGILAEHAQRGTPISLDQIRNAVRDLYGEWEALPESSSTFIQNVMENRQFAELYAQAVLDEEEAGSRLVQFEQEYPDVLTRKNVDEIADSLQKKTDRESILAQLRSRKTT